MYIHDHLLFAFDEDCLSGALMYTLVLLNLRPCAIQVNNPGSSWKANFDQHFALQPYFIHRDNTVV